MYPLQTIRGESHEAEIEREREREDVLGENSIITHLVFRDS